nr:reverse transcriptase domain-containing protein [Tanacetum cinerariifolium]
MNEANMKAMKTQIDMVKTELRNEMKSSIQTFLQMNTASRSGSLPSNTVANLKGELKAITTRSGLITDGPTVPTPPKSITLKVDERIDETFTDSNLANFNGSGRWGFLKLFEHSRHVGSHNTRLLLDCMKLLRLRPFGLVFLDEVGFEDGSRVSLEEDQRLVSGLTDLWFQELLGAARRWLEKEPPCSITTWEDLVSKFINEFFPPSRTTNLRNEISNFQQRFDESFHEAWDRYKDLLHAFPHRGFTELHQLDTFYNVLNPGDQDSLNAAA